MECDDVHYIDAGNLRHKRVVGQTGVQHGAVGTALNRSRCHSRVHAGAHQDRNEDGACRCRRASRTGQRHVHGIGPEDNTGNQQPVYF